jgi:hypothetical protein
VFLFCQGSAHDVIYGPDSLNKIMSESDYIVCLAPLMAETQGLVGAQQFDHAKKNAVFIHSSLSEYVHTRGCIPHAWKRERSERHFRGRVNTCSRIERM